MTLEEFNELDMTEQAKAVWGGDFVEHRKTPEATISLYSLGSFFVEAWYTRDHSKFIKFHPFESPSLINLYTSRISN